MSGKKSQPKSNSSVIREKFVRQAQNALKNKNIDKAIHHFTEALELFPDDADLHNNLGVLFYKKKDYDASRSCLKKAIDLNPKYFDPHYNLVKVTIKLDDKNQAVGYLKTCLSIRPDHADAKTLLSQMQSEVDPINQKKLAVCCLPGFEHFLLDIIEFLKLEYDVRTCYSTDGAEIESVIRWADIVWLEWANELTVSVTNHPTVLNGKRVICRLHSYEAFHDYIDQVDWKKIDHTIFVAPHVRAFVLDKIKDVDPARTSLVPNGIDLEKFAFQKRRPGYHLAYLGMVNHKKGPMLLLHAFRELVQIDEKYRLFMAGGFQESRYKLYFDQMISEMNLEKHIHFSDWVEDVPSWLEDKHFLVSSSPLEGHPVGIMEAMACGIKPVVHNFFGARGLFPDHYIWNTIPAFIRLVREKEYDSNQYRNYITEHFPIQKQLADIKNILQQLPVKSNHADHSVRPDPININKGDEKKRPDPDGNTQKWHSNPNVFSDDPNVRINEIWKIAEKQVSMGRLDLAEVLFDRLAKMTNYSEEKIIHNLIALCQKRQDIGKIKAMWKRAAVSALQRNNLDIFLEYGYLSIYSENFYSKCNQYEYAVIDEDINAFVRITATHHPLMQWVQENKKKRAGDNRARRLKVGFILEGFSQLQAPTRTYLPIANHYDRARYELYFYSRWSMNESIAQKEKYDISVYLFKKRGCHVRTPLNKISPMGQVEYLTKAIVEDEIDILVFQTTYFVPVYNFISCLRPASVQAAVCHQQPEYSQEIDLTFTVDKKKALEISSPISYQGSMMLTKNEDAAAHDRADYHIPKSAVLLVSANRELYYRQKEFWREIHRVLKHHDNVTLMLIGLSEANFKQWVPELMAFKERIITPGYREDVMNLLKMADIYVDLFPIGAGSSVIEAMSVGLPVVTFEENFSTLFQVNKTNAASYFIPLQTLIIPHGHFSKWHTVLQKLIVDETFRKEAGQAMIAGMEKYRPEKVVQQFFNHLQKAYMNEISLKDMTDDAG